MQLFKQTLEQELQKLENLQLKDEKKLERSIDELKLNFNPKVIFLWTIFVLSSYAGIFFFSLYFTQTYSSPTNFLANFTVFFYCAIGLLTARIIYSEVERTKQQLRRKCRNAKQSIDQAD